MVGEIISEWWATSNRNGGRDHSGMVGDIERNQQTVFGRRLLPLIWHFLFAPALYAMGDADFVRYLHQAQNCLHEAERATREVDREAWLKLGEEWMEMARKARRQGPSKH
jgi:hypothetical protein